MYFNCSNYSDLYRKLFLVAIKLLVEQKHLNTRFKVSQSIATGDNVKVRQTPQNNKFERKMQKARIRSS